jgi:aminopeptidase N
MNLKLLLMKQAFILFILFSFSLSAQNLRSGGKLKSEQAIMDIRHYTVALSVDPIQQSIDGYTEIDLILSATSPVILLDLWHGLTVKQIFVNGKKEEFTHSNDDLLTISGIKPFLPAKKIKVKVEYGGKPGIAVRPPWTGGFQWSSDEHGNPWIAVTCQSEGAKIYFPCKDHPSDEPNEGADMIITVPKGLSVAAPGLLKNVKNDKATSTWHWKTNYTISNYCIVFNVGKYTKVTRSYVSVDGNKIPMEFYVLEEHADKGQHELEIMERTCHVLEKYFGEYPWAKEKIGLAETPHLGMEHQSMIAYGNKFRYTKVGGEDFDWLLTHEFGHEWWANKVTNKDWAHMWIQEGICSFGDHLYTRELAGEQAYLKQMQQTARNTQNVIPIVQGEEIDSDQTYHGDIYGKGAFFMHTLRFVLGDSIFFPTLKKLATDKKYTYDNFVTTDDVEQLFSSASGRDLGTLFDFYLRTTNKLEIDVKQVKENQYLVKVLNFEGSLPVEILADGRITKGNIDKTGITVTSSSWPQIDPNVYYLKKVILE